MGGENVLSIGKIYQGDILSHIGKNVTSSFVL